MFNIYGTLPDEPTFHKILNHVFSGSEQFNPNSSSEKLNPSSEKFNPTPGRPLEHQDQQLTQVEVQDQAA